MAEWPELSAMHMNDYTKIYQYKEQHLELYMYTVQYWLQISNMCIKRAFNILKNNNNLNCVVFLVYNLKRDCREHFLLVAR